MSSARVHLLYPRVPIPCEEDGEEDEVEAEDVEATFPTKSHLRDHMNKLHSGKMYKCDMCGMRSNIKTNVKRHAAAHDWNTKSKWLRTWRESQLTSDLRKEMAICGLRLDTELNIELDLV